MDGNSDGIDGRRELLVPPADGRLLVLRYFIFLTYLRSSCHSCRCSAMCCSVIVASATRMRPRRLPSLSEPLPPAPRPRPARTASTPTLVPYRQKEGHRERTDRRQPPVVEQGPVGTSGGRQPHRTRPSLTTLPSRRRSFPPTHPGPRGTRRFQGCPTSSSTHPSTTLDSTHKRADRLRRLGRPQGHRPGRRRHSSPPTDRTQSRSPSSHRPDQATSNNINS